MLEKSKHTSGSDSKIGSKSLKIRAHHLCCIQGFQGYGYSPVFVANMRAVISDLEACPSTSLELVSECDVICLSCPKQKGMYYSEINYFSQDQEYGPCCYGEVKDRRRDY